jgi:apolipoprotein N-acyltransferase
MEKRGYWLSALLGVLAFPPLGLWPVAYIAMVPFLSSATASAAKHPFRTAYWAGVFFFAGVIYWIGFNSGAPWYFAWPSVIAMILILATIWGFTAWAVSVVNRRWGIASAALLFVALSQFQELFWGTGELGFPWAIWALTQTTFLPAIQMAEFVDGYGISMWVLVINALIFLQARGFHTKTCRIAAVVIILIPLLYGVVRMRQVDTGEQLRVAAVQANTPASEKWQMSAEEILEDHVGITRGLIGKNVELVVWPETATPVPLRYKPWALTALHQLCDSLNAVIVTGATDYKSDPDTDQVPYNSAFVIRPHSRGLESSAKVQLVPFGERIPWQNYFPILGEVQLGQAEFKPGDHPVVFSGAGAPDFGCLICFEVVFPEIAASLVNDGAQILAHITNDGWYGNTSGPYQHLYLARLRAVVTRRSIVRAANTGISALILPSGRFLDQLGYDKAGSIQGSLPLRTDRTPAVRLASFWYPFYSALLLGLRYPRGRRFESAILMPCDMLADCTRICDFARPRRSMVFTGS